MARRDAAETALLSVLGLAVGCAIAALVIRTLLLPIEFLLNRTANLLTAEGGLAWYVSRTLVWAIVAGLVGAIVGAIHNEFIKRHL